MTHIKSQMTIAIDLAVKAHKDQKYGELPYVYHLAQVDNIVTHAYAPKNMKPSEPFSKHPGDEMDNLRAIAFLHDVLEDTDYSTIDLSIAGVSEVVLEAVIAITKVEGESYEDYIKKVLENPLATKVKLCDTSANLMNSIKEGNTKRINKYSKQLQLLGGFQ